MKKALLFLTFTAITVSSFAQLAVEKLLPNNHATVSVAPQQHFNLLSAARTTGIITVKDSVFYPKDAYQFVPDSILHFYVIDRALPIDSGFLFGTNALLNGTTTTLLGAAEAYSFNHTVDANDTSWTVIGVIGIWFGTVDSTSTHSLTYKIWSIDTNITPSPITGLDSLIGIPDQTLDSVNVNFTALNVNTGNYGVGWFATPISNLQTGIWAGYELTTPWSSLSGDTIVLGATSQRALGTTDKNTVFHRSAVDSAILVRGAYEMNSTWYDYSYDLGFNGYLAIAPVVDITANPESVKGIQNNNLTFFGNYPNPATTSTNIKFSLKNSADVTVYVSDMTGRLLKTVEQPGLSSGNHIITLNTFDLAAGNYIYMVRTSQGGAMACKLTVIK
ncbi:MAG TPA: T9SS type A sorting domain-containing protein [Flavipsychrobacter sp.]|nr:T9SS type A sorting domain-containing protein [Flavipsychrobacter sp.]